MTASILETLAREFQITTEQCQTLLNLLDQDYAVAYIATCKSTEIGGLNENKILKFQKRQKDISSLQDKKNKTIQFFNDHDKLTDTIRSAIEAATSKTEVNDIYLPHQPNKQSKAQIAIQHGLKPLAQFIMEQKPLVQPLESMATDYTSHVPEFNTVPQVLDGVRAIVCEWIAEDHEIKKTLRDMYLREGVLNCKPTAKALDNKNVYEEFFDLAAPANTLTGTRYLAIQRGERQKFLTTQIEIDNEKAIALIKAKYATSTDDSLRFLMESLVSDSFHKMISVQFQHEIKQRLWEISQESASQSYLTNYKQQLLQSPLSAGSILAVYPGEEAGCGCALMDKDGNKLLSCTIFIHDDRKQDAESRLLEVLKQNSVSALVVGIANFHRETLKFLKNILAANNIQLPVLTLQAHEAATFVESEDGRKYFSEDEYTAVKAACYLAQKITNPLEALAKVDPLTLALGSYQKDVDQQQLKKRLQGTLQSVLCRVGVDVNKASVELIANLPGLDMAQAQLIKNHIQTVGAIKTSVNLASVEGLSDLAKTQISAFIALNDRPHKRDPRPQMELINFDPAIKSIADLKLGETYKARVSHFTPYGIFADLGLDSDILIHRNNLPDDIRSNYATRLKLGQTINIKTTQIDSANNRAQFELLPKEQINKSFARPQRPHPRQSDRRPDRKHSDQRHGKPSFGGNRPRADAQHKQRRPQFGTLGDQFKNLLGSQKDD